jgi:hypothetical protein
MISEPLKLGKTVKFVTPATAEEAEERFIVLELRGDRVLVEFICDLAIRPTFVYLIQDLSIVPFPPSHRG